MRKKKALEKLNQITNEFQQTEFRLNTLNVQYEKMLNDYKVCYSALEASQKRIKELSEENQRLNDEVETLRNNNAKLCEDIETRRSREIKAEAKVEEVAPIEVEEEAIAEAIEETAEESFEAKESPAIEEAKQPAREVKVSEIEKYGAAAIGNVVVEATRIIGDLAAKSGPNTKDTLTLALGRTEVLKSEVLAIVGAQGMEDSEKKQKIDACREQAMEYLASVAAQN